MSENEYAGQERRRFVRIDYSEPLMYKVCKPETISKLLDGYTQNISQSGILCKLKENIPQDAIIWLSFDMNTLEICREIEKQSVIIQRGLLAKVVRVCQRSDGYFDVGACFVTREEKNQGFIALCNKLNKEMTHT
jgi:c-di-GMP-binding flagellar brake protein YcgR